MRLLCLAALALVLDGCASLAPIESAPITKTELRALRPAEATDLVLDQLSNTLLFQSPPTHPARPPQRPLHDAFFYTRPRSTNYPGRCTSDQLIVYFAPVNRTDLGAATPVRAVGVETTALFYFLSPPATIDPRTAGQVPEPQEALCAALDPRRDDFFSADDEERAWQAATLLLLAQQRARDASSGFELVCRSRGGGCDAALQRIDIVHPHVVRRCILHDYSGSCVEVFAGDVGVTIQAREVVRRNE